MRAFASLILAVLILAAASAPPAAAQLSRDWTACENQGKAFSSDVAISGCTAVIQSGRESAGNRAIAYSNRGNAFQAKGDNDRAIADHTNAIRLNPNHALAYTNRGVAYQARAKTTEPSPTSTRPSGSIRTTPSPTPVAASRT